MSIEDPPYRVCGKLNIGQKAALVSTLEKNTVQTGQTGHREVNCQAWSRQSKQSLIVTASKSVRYFGL